MSDLFQRRFAQLGVSKLLTSQENFSGLDLQTFRVNNGSRMLFFLDIQAIDGAATLNVTVANAADVTQEFLERHNQNYTAIGQYPIHLMDIHKFFVVTITVSGGNATYSVGATLSDNSTSEDAEATLSAIDSKLGNITASTGTLTSVSASVTSVTLLAANANRKGFILHNDSNSSCFVAFTGTASATSFTVRIPANGNYDRQFANYTGTISCIWVAALGAMRITELT